MTDVDNGQKFYKVADAQFDRWRCDPQYNLVTAEKMHGTGLPIQEDFVEGWCAGLQGWFANVLATWTTKLSNVSSGSPEHRLDRYERSSKKMKHPS